MSKSKKNTIVPAVGMILALKSQSQSKKTGPAKVLQVDRDKGNVVVFRPGGRIPRTVINFDSLDRYAPFVEGDFPEIDFNESGQAKSALSTDPSVPRPTVAHEPPPPAPEPAANDTTAAPLAKADIDAAVERVESRMESRFAALMREQREEFRAQQAESNAFFERLLERFGPGHAATTKTPAPVAVAPSKKSKDEQDAINKEIVRRESPWAEPLIHRFIDAELEVVQFDSPKNIERAMFPGEFHDALVVWCQQVGEIVPDQRTTFALLDDRISPSRHTVKDSQGKRRKTMFARRRQMNLDLTGNGEFVDVMNNARCLWPSFKDDSTVALRIKAMLASQGRRNGATAEEMVEAMRGAALEIKHKGAIIFPETVFSNVSAVRVYTKIARDFGGGK